MGTVTHLPASPDRAPGLVRNGGDISITFRYNGADHVVKRLRSGDSFETALSSLLRRAEVAGTFVLTGSTTVKGTSHTHGLMIGMPIRGRNAIELYWHAERASNADRCGLSISCPHGMDPFTFRGKLLQAKKVADAGEESDRPTAPTTVPGPIDELVGQEPPRDAAQSGLSEALAILDDPDILQPILEILYGYADAAGLVEQDTCVLVLTTELLFEEQDCASAISKMVAKGFLEALEGNVSQYRVPEATRQKTRTPTILTTAPESTEPPAAVNSRKSNVESAFDELKRKATVADQLQRRITETEAEIAGISALLEAAQQRRERYVKHLARPEIKAALEKYQTVKAALGL